MKLVIRLYLSIYVGIYVILTYHYLISYAPPDYTPPAFIAETDLASRNVVGLLLTQIILLIWAIKDLERTAIPLQIFCISIFFSGVGQLVSISNYGFATPQSFLLLLSALSTPLILYFRQYALSPDRAENEVVRLSGTSIEQPEREPLK